MSNPPGHAFTPKRRRFDVFLSFRGKGTRHGFTNDLFARLIDQGINVFLEGKTHRRGFEISSELSSVIEDSAIAVRVLSKNYASSTWCLNEIAKIIECHDTRRLIVLPVFYHLEPSDVRKQKGGYGEAFAEHTRRLGDRMEMVERWRKALERAVNFSGWIVGMGNKTELIRSIIKDVLGKLRRKQLHVADFPINLEPQLLNCWGTFNPH